ncbi:NAD(P)/FAD-dependent oxidoreductase [Staphylococcus arlettae]|uniref:NAD(P)/FAD-dependent oxidoreductase n=1 Tax=Staphylococcus arlettae TaxID=29378 RepID=UPI00107298BB|nr:NAD(P)/FAD-dependent oxidoreductase [Staphylococcus arlettae]MBF0737737.1 NAD(P)/FAD-dependent oxidoreductase [Staphylococcus arlettae]TFU47038.1 NAD(P)/FAD-dependent oxidoreductase [Staphylococcus arlettae]
MFDVIIIGGGPAGLASALTLGRALKTTLVIDNNNPRNKVTQASHAYLTQDGISPEALRSNAEQDVDKYEHVQRVLDTVTHVEQVTDYFIIQTESTTYYARKIMLAMGLKETLPDTPGTQACYGTSLFYCPWCDGYELRNRSLIVSVPAAQVKHMSKLVLNWSQDVVIHVADNASIDDEDKAYLDRKGIRLITSAITEYQHTEGHLTAVIFADGTSINRDGGLIGIEVNSYFDFIQPLQLQREDNGRLTTNNFGETSVPGVFVVGESKDIMPSQLIDAASSGNTVAKFVAMQLIEDND